MPIVSDFTIINKPTITAVTNPSHPDGQRGTWADPYVIGDDSDPGGRFTQAFSTGGMHNSPALLSLMFKGLRAGSARVAITSAANPAETQIGRLMPSASAADADIWRHEQFIIPTNVLSTSSQPNQNTLIIGRVRTNDSPTDQFDDFLVRDIVCYFHQQA